MVWDVPRDAAGKAIIADPRNDQTLIILQMHVAMQMFHNKLVDYMRAIRIPRAAVFESARRLARWHYQWMVTHDFLPAIVGKAMADSVYKEVLTGVPIINIKYYKPTNPLGSPSSRSSSRWPHTASATASPGPATPSRTSSQHRRHRGRLERAAVRGRAQRQQLERVPRGAASAEDSVEQVLQPGGGRPHRPARAPVRRFAGRPAVQDCPRRCSPTAAPRACSRSGTSSGARRWACPRDSRWLS